MEQMELWDENRRPLNRLITRGEKLRDGEYVTAAEVWVINGKSHLLTTLRDPQKPQYPSLWEVSGGAALPGEEGRQTAARELFEETGIDAGTDELLFMGTVRGKSVFMDSYLLVKEVAPDAVRLQPGETADVKWVTKKELLAMEAKGLMVPAVMARYHQYKAILSPYLDGYR